MKNLMSTKQGFELLRILANLNEPRIQKLLLQKLVFLAQRPDESVY